MESVRPPRLQPPRAEPWQDDVPHRRASGIRPLPGLGPWTLVEVADAVGVSYDAVYHDVRHGILTARTQAGIADRARYVVTITDLRRSARPCYRHVPRAIPADGSAVGPSPARIAGTAAERPRPLWRREGSGARRTPATATLKGVLAEALMLIAADTDPGSPE